MTRTSSMIAGGAAATFAVSSAAPVVLCPPIRRIATFHLNSLHDLLFSLPALHSLREGFPGAHICAVLRPGLAALLEDSPLVDEILLRPSGGVSAQAALMARLTTHHFDIALAFSQSRQCSLLAFSTRAPVRLGYQGAKMDALLTHHIAPDGPFSIEGALDFVRALGCAVHQYDYCGLVQPSAADAKIADALLETRGLSGEFLLVACAPVERKYERRTLAEWPVEKWIEALRGLSSRWPIVLIGSRTMPAVAQAIGGAVHDFGGKTTLPVLAALCGKAKLVLGADSGVLHLAAAMKTPVIGVYGPTDWQQTGPRGVSHRIVRHPVECSPCLLNKCKWTGADERKCLTHIAPDALVHAVHDLIGILMLPQPISAQLQEGQRVLIAGAGGGFDVVCGLPLFFALEKLGCEVHLANLSFSRLSEATAVNRHGPELFEVTQQSQGTGYFPEGHLSRWFASHLKRNVPIWCFQATGVRPYVAMYVYLLERLQIDAVLLVDGGVDSLLRGDEHSLGTPLWDALSVAAVNELELPSFLASVAFGAERWDKICHSQALERIAELTAKGALLGVSSLLPQASEAQHFMYAASYIFTQQPEIRPSTVVSSMLAALRGEFGERPVNAFTQATPLWVSPLMNLYWFFDLPEVARRNLYMHRLRDTQTLAEAAERLSEFTDAQIPAPWENIPI